jgi:hypothetical protein
MLTWVSSFINNNGKGIPKADEIIKEDENYLVGHHERVVRSLKETYDVRYCCI